MKRLLGLLLETSLPPLLFFALVVGLWQAATVLWEIPAYLVPSPARVMAAAREHAAEGDIRDFVAALRFAHVMGRDEGKTR